MLAKAKIELKKKINVNFQVLNVTVHPIMFCMINITVHPFFFNSNINLFTPDFTGGSLSISIRSGLILNGCTPVQLTLKYYHAVKVK